MNREGKVPLFVWVNKEEKRRFHETCFLKGITMTEVISTMISDLSETDQVLQSVSVKDKESLSKRRRRV